MDDEVAQFTGITGSTAQIAQQYLKISDGSLEHALQLFFDSGGIDLQGQENAAAAAAASSSATVAPPTAPAGEPTGRGSAAQDAIEIDSGEDISDDNDPEVTGWKRDRAPKTEPARPTNVEDDEAMARRMQEELFGGSQAGGAAGEVDPDGVRAPLARTTETLVGPDSHWSPDGPEEMRAAIAAQLQARRQRQAGRPGIFNQQPVGGSVWEDDEGMNDGRRQHLSRATGGASEASSKASLLADMYRPPAELISRLPWDAARQEGKDNLKWLLVNVQDPAVFDCQVLNRDIWKDEQVKTTVKEHFIFMQYNKDDPRGNQYIQYYFQAKDSQDAYPHIAIVDPRTGEQVKVWSGPPVPPVMEFLSQLYEFLDRYSLDVNAKNPVAMRKAERKPSLDVDKMTEDQMLEMAMQNSLENKAAERREDDPDALTRGSDALKKGKAASRGDQEPSDADVEDTAIADSEPSDTGLVSPFASISASNPHTEPSADPATTTRIQFRHSGGRIIRRFSLEDPVRRLYEWLKAEPLEGKEGIDFELVCTGRNLMEVLEDTVEQAGLKNQTVMIEFLEA